MRCKSMLLGGAMVLALSVAAFAQGTSGSDQTNGSPTAAQPTSGQFSGTSPTSTSESTTPAAHRHRHHVHRTTREAYLHGPSTPAERRETYDLNKQQLQQAESAANQRPPGEMTTSGSAMNGGAQPASGSPTSYTAPQNGAQPGPGNAGPYYQQPQNNGTEPGPSYMSAPGANGPVGAPGNPATPADQNGPTPNGSNGQPSNSVNQPGPSG